MSGSYIASVSGSNTLCAFVTMLIKNVFFFLSITYSGNIFILPIQLSPIQAMKFNVPRPVAVCVTCLQIVQMAIGLAVATGVATIKSRGGSCNQSYGNVVLTLAMYISYLVLFLHFFYRAYATPRGAGGDRRKEKKIAENGEGHLVRQNGTKKRE